MKHQIQRINNYNDTRFSKEILLQHGAFIIDNKHKCCFRITQKDTAIVEYDKEINIDALINEFRFYSEHITKFYNTENKIIKEFKTINRFRIDIKDIQPSQFYVDEDKVEAVRSFINNNEDIIIPLVKINNEFISLDGHTRLYIASKLGYKQIYGFLTEADDYINYFVAEAKKRNILTPFDLSILKHDIYEEKWNKFCDDYFK